MTVPKILNYEVELRAVIPKENFQRPPVVYTNDLRSAEFRFQVTDMEAGDLSEATATTLLYMRDGSFFQNPKEDVILDGTTFSYTLKENEGNHAGIAKIQLVVTIPAVEPDLPVDYASQLYEFEIANGLETKVAPELMIQDWTTLTRDARAYIDQFVADEMLRDAEFDNAQFDRNAAFTADQTTRTDAFNADQGTRATEFSNAQTARTNAYAAAEADRDADFEESEGLRQAGYDADHSRAGTDHTTAANDHTLAGTDHTTAANDHTLAGTDHTRAESDHTRADADSATVAGFIGRLTAEETATAANKISAVKSKTFADVDARFEDVEADGSFMASNLVTNGDFSNGVTDWGSGNATASASNGWGVSTADGTASSGIFQQNEAFVSGAKYYCRAKVKANSSACTSISLGSNITNSLFYYLPTPTNGVVYTISGIGVATTDAIVRVRHYYADAATASGKSIEVDDVLLLNLTATFGAGNEPTSAEIDRLLSRFSNSWFDGTKNLFLAKTAIEKQIQLDAGAIMDATNGIVNGDFSSGTSGWISPSSTITVSSSNVASVTGSGSDLLNRFSNLTSLPAKANNKIYLKVSAQVTDSVCSALTLQLRTGIQANVIGDVVRILPPAINTWYTMSAVATIQEVNANGTLGMYLFSTYADNATQTGKVMNVKYATIIDLTATFGAGNEPTAEQMDSIMAKFDNAWFRGTKNVFQAKASLNKLMALDTRTEFDVKNALNNGAFASGNTGWTVTAATLSTSNYVGTLTGDGSQAYAQITQSWGARNGQKIYCRAMMRALNTDVQSLTLYSDGATANTPVLLPALNGWYAISGITTAQTTGLPATFIARATYPDAATALGKSIEVKYLQLIDLTAAFGAGKEPTLAEMDRLMARFPNSWFDGAKPVQTIETLYQEKANKVQEAWITPTLLNGWVKFADGADLQYRKTELGEVVFRGIIKSGTYTNTTLLFTLPTGYRPAVDVRIPIATWTGTTYTVTTVLLIQVNGGVSIYGATGNLGLCLDGVCAFTN